MSQFKAGDKVRVIDASGLAERHLTLGGIYTVEKDSTDVNVKCVGVAGFYPHRFEKVEPFFKVGDRVTVDGGVTGVLEVEAVVVGDVGTFRYLLVDADGCYAGAGWYRECDLRTYVGPVAPEKTAPNPNPKKAFGETKPNLALIPPVALLHMAMALEDGDRKYGAFNWRKDPVEAMTYIAAAMRHLQNWLDGEETTADSVVHNLGCVMAGCGIVLDSQALGILIDNRPPPGKSSEVQEQLKAQKIAQAAARGAK